MFYCLGAEVRVWGDILRKQGGHENQTQARKHKYNLPFSPSGQESYPVGGAHQEDSSGDNPHDGRRERTSKEAESTLCASAAPFRATKMRQYPSLGSRIEFR